ncbi:ABC transporter substrate-binding protein [Pseudomonas sp. PDNC002]|uniref:ABC transporter substrate-binding protein n=1 Tax=Pseudomonas sp. PDNC002 TaxID=2811422 RepID=UPI00196421F8|nr:ABC transporter substrate-binding protein [Pseudomonas sp. PDNC002]QRY80999.1 ABC transporter substrate-binding protein [Pseudomonas sp. PDNC002]
MSAWTGLREEREVGRRLARRIAGLFEQGMGRREMRDERFQRRVVRHGQPMMKTWRSRLALTPTLSRGERGLGGAGWRVWSMPEPSLSWAP